MNMLILGSMCQLWLAFPDGPFQTGVQYHVACGSGVDALLLDLSPVDPENPADPPQIISVDLGGECGSQIIAFPPGLPSGKYRLSGTMIACGACASQPIRPRIVVVE